MNLHRSPTYERRLVAHQVLRRASDGASHEEGGEEAARADVSHGVRILKCRGSAPHETADSGPRRAVGDDKFYRHAYGGLPSYPARIRTVFVVRGPVADMRAGRRSPRCTQG